MRKQETEKTQHHVIICQGINCRRNGSQELIAPLQQALSQDTAFEVSHHVCFGACGVAPNIVVMPDRLWYSFAAPAYIDDVVAAIRRGEELPGLAHHVRPDVMAAVFRAFVSRGIT